MICKLLSQFVFDLADVFFSLLLLICENSYFHLFRSNHFFDGCKKLFRNGAAGIAVFFLAAFCYDRIDESDDFLVDLMSCKDRFDHLIFRYFVGAGFDHDDLFSCGSYCQLQIRCISLLCGRVKYQFSVYQAHLCSRCRTIKGDVRDGCCNGCAQHSGQLRCTVRVNGKHQVV